MREITKTIAEFFEGADIENSLKLGIRNILAFGEKTFCLEDEKLTLFVSESYENFTESFKKKGITLPENESLLCSLLHFDFSIEELMIVLRQLKTFPEGTTVVFTHSGNMLSTEKMLSNSGFRTVEHFSLDRVADYFGKCKLLTEKNCYCLCVKK